MNHQIDLQIACEDALPVSEDCLIGWVQKTLEPHEEEVELTLRLVDIDEITELNTLYRKQNKPTNVLAFPGNIPEGIELEYAFLGDIIVCPAVLKTEAIDQKTPLEAHWAHIVIHGVLHLLGFDHIEEADFKVMQAKEIELLDSLGFANPYHQEGNHIE